MLHERLIGTLLTMPTSAARGEITRYGIHYHYRAQDDEDAGDKDVVNAIPPLAHRVTKPEHALHY